MKKAATLLTVATLFCFVHINGQTTLGIKGGVNIANMTGNNYKPRVSGHGGIFVNRSISNNFFIQPEVLFSGEGQRYIWAGVEHKWALDYLQIPVMLQYYPIPQLYIEAGPQVGFLISAKDKLGGTHANMNANISSVQVAIGAGLGIKATDRIVLYGRYNLGLSDITTSFYDVFELNNNVVQLGIAARLYK